MSSRPILIAGATGYIGRMLALELAVERGAVRCLGELERGYHSPTITTAKEIAAEIAYSDLDGSNAADTTAEVTLVRVRE